MHMSIAICDDDAAQRDYLRKLASLWAEQAGLSAAIRLFESAEAFWFAYQGDKNWHLILLDIQMKGMDGVALAQQIRRDNQDVQIVFVTGYTDYLAEGYEVSALHYLLKPVNEAKLFAVLDKAQTRLGRGEQAIVINFGGESMRVLTETILVVEAFAHSTVLKTTQGPLETKLSITSMETMLERQGFVRCHRSYLVGLRHIRRISKNSALLDDGSEVPLSRSAYDSVNRAFIAYYRRLE